MGRVPISKLGEDRKGFIIIQYGAEKRKELEFAENATVPVSVLILMLSLAVLW